MFHTSCLLLLLPCYLLLFLFGNLSTSHCPSCPGSMHSNKPNADGAWKQIAACSVVIGGASIRTTPISRKNSQKLRNFPRRILFWTAEICFCFGYTHEKKRSIDRFESLCDLT